MSNVTPTKSSFRDGKNFKSSEERQELSQLQSADSLPLRKFEAKIKFSIWKIWLRLRPASDVDKQISNSNLKSCCWPSFLPEMHSRYSIEHKFWKNDNLKQVKVEVTAEKKSKLTSLLFGIETQTSSWSSEVYSESNQTSTMEHFY